MKNEFSVEKLSQIMDQLLGPNGCPWDKAQSNQSLAPYAIEEAAELADALLAENPKHIVEELGDVLFQVIFHCALGKKKYGFKFNDVVDEISDKLVRRHPHVFSDTKVAGVQDVLSNWEKIKSKEKEQNPPDPLDVPTGLPSLQRAQKIGDKTKKLKFDWENASQVFEKVEEEFLELKEARTLDDKNKIEEELGDMFFVLTQFARHLNLDAETVSRKASLKFEGRFRDMLKLAQSRKLDFNQLTLTEKENLWTEIKSKK